MGCGDYSEVIDSVSQGAAQDFVTCAYINDLGVYVWPLIIIGALMAGAFAATRSPVPPIILMLLLGPLFVATLPGAGANLLALSGIFTIPSVLFLTFLRFKQAQP